MFVGLSRQLVLRRALDITANNIANMTTAGFKLERPAEAVDRTRDASHMDGPRGVAFVDHRVALRDFSSGPLETTGRSLDFALESDGFFMVRDGADIRYTRDGRFALDPDGRLVTQAGLPVLDDGQVEIFLPPGAAVVATSDGELSVDEQAVARLGVVEFDDRAVLTKERGLLFAAEGPPPPPAFDPKLRQGAVERSNVDGIREITTLIEIQRSYESVSRMISNVEELRRRAIDRLGRTN